MTKTKVFLLVNALSLVIVSGEFNLTVLHTGDVRGRMVGNQKYDGECGAKAEGPSGYKFCHGGIAARVKYFEHVVNATENVLKIDNGDFFFGTLWWRKWGGFKMMEFVNGALFEDDAVLEPTKYTAQPMYDAIGISNADLSEGPASLAHLLKIGEPRMILSNFDVSEDPHLKDCVTLSSHPCAEPWAIIEKGGREIGVLNMSPLNLKDIAIIGQIKKAAADNDIIAYMQALVTKLQIAHPECNIIILCANLHVSLLLDVARKVLGIDIVLGSHDTAAYVASSGKAFPYTVTNMVGDTVYISANLRFGSSVSHIDYIFDNDGKVIGLGKRAELVTLDTSTLGFDKFTWDKVYAQHQIIENEINNKAIGYANFWMNGQRGDPDHNECTQAIASDSCPEGHLSLSHADECCPYSTGDSRKCDSQCTPEINEIENSWSWAENKSSDTCCPQTEDKMERFASATSCCSKNIWWDNYGVRHSDTGVGHLVSNAMMWKCADCDLVFINGGGLRDDLGVKDSIANYTITMGHILKLFPFYNALSTATVSGSTLVAIMTHAVSQYNARYGNGKFANYAGARIAFNPNEADLISAEVCTEWNRKISECTGTWKKLEGMALSETYRIGLSSYGFGGGDGYSMIKPSATDIKEFGPTISSVIADFIADDAFKNWNKDYLTTLKDDCVGFKMNYITTLNSTNCRAVKAADESPFKCPSWGSQKCVDGKWDILGIEQPVKDGITFACTRCSGFGVCNELAGYKCECAKSTVAGFEWPRQYITKAKVCDTSSGIGLPFAGGEDCSTMRKRDGRASVAISLICGGIICFLSTAFSLWILKNRGHGVVRASLPQFQHLANLGCFLCGVSVVAQAQEPSKGMCNTAIALQGIGFIGIISPLMCKTAIIDAIFNNRSLKLHDNIATKMMWRTFLIIIVEIALLVLMCVIAPYDKTLMILEDEERYPHSYSIVCRSIDGTGASRSTMWTTSVLAINLMILFWAIYNAVLVRNVSSIFGEAKWIGFVLYNLTIFGGIGVMISFFTESDPASQFILTALMNMIACSGSTIIMWIPKLLLVQRIGAHVTPQELASTKVSQESGGSALSSMVSTKGRALSSLIERLKAGPNIDLSELFEKEGEVDEAVAAGKAFLAFLEPYASTQEE